jgi:hypothetical protein
VFNQCPVALAIKRVVNPLYRFAVVVGNTNIYIQKERVEHSEKSRIFVFLFDNRRKVYPTSFYLDIPPEFLEKKAKNCT